jgi:hypothetical protein
MTQNVKEIIRLLAISFLASGLLLVLFVIPFVFDIVGIELILMTFIILGVTVFLFAILLRKFYYGKVLLSEKNS